MYFLQESTFSDGTTTSRVPTTFGSPFNLEAKTVYMLLAIFYAAVKVCVIVYHQKHLVQIVPCTVYFELFLTKSTLLY